MKNKKIIYISITIILIIIVIVFLLINNKEKIINSKFIEQKEQTNDMINNESNNNLQDTSENKNDNRINKLIGMNINDIESFVDDINNSSTTGVLYEISYSYNKIPTDDKNLNGIIKNYSIIENNEDRLPTNIIDLDVYFFNYSLEEKQEILDKIKYECRVEGNGTKEINSTNLTIDEVSKLLEQYSIDFDIEATNSNEEKIMLSRLYDEEGEKYNQNEGGRHVDINTFDIDTIERLKKGIIQNICIKDRDTGKFLKELNDNSYLAITTFNITNEDYSKIYEYLENREKDIPDSEFINEDDSNLPIHLNKRYMICYDKRARINVGNNIEKAISNKCIYFTGNNKIVLDDYVVGRRYYVGTYTIKNNTINVNINKLVRSKGYGPDISDLNIPEFQIEIIDKEKLLYKFNNEYGNQIKCYYYCK